MRTPQEIQAEIEEIKSFRHDSEIELDEAEERVRFYKDSVAGWDYKLNSLLDELAESICNPQ